MVSPEAFLGGRLDQRGRLDDQRRGRPQRAAGDDQEVAQQNLRIDIGLRDADRQRDTGKTQAQPAPLRCAQPFA